jgi:cell division protease FtsH
MRKVDSEIRRIIDEQYAAARKILEENRDKVEAMATALLEWETIDSDQIDDIMAGRPPRPPKERSSGGGSSAGTATAPSSGASPAAPAEPAAP